MNRTNRQARSKRKAKQNRVMRNPLGSQQQDVIKLLKKALRRPITRTQENAMGVPAPAIEETPVVDPTPEPVVDPVAEPEVATA